MNRNQVRAVKRMLRIRNACVLGSLDNLYEAFRINDPAARVQRVEVIRRLTKRKERIPDSYRQAMALLDEIRRCRSDWLNPYPDLRHVKLELANHRQHWDAVKNELPAQWIHPLCGAAPALSKSRDDA